jgi:hypothetical protein
MGRPADWRPLAESDPVPGDPVQVAAEADHLAKVALEIQQQVARLRAISDDQSVLKGEYAGKLRSAAADVADGLGQVAGRYQKVSGTLRRWVPELEHAQSESLKALAAAQDAAARQQQHGRPSAQHPGRPPTPQERDADHARQRALTAANDDLAAARGRLDNAVGYRDSNGRGRAADIRSAIDDAVADSWWDTFKDVIGNYAWLLRDAAEFLEVVATFLAIVALLIPGLDLVVILALAVASAALLLRTVLAATGNGSWLDVAFDTLALLTFGLGGLAGNAMKATVSESEAIAQGLIDAERGASALGQAGAYAERVSRFADGLARALPGTIVERAIPLVSRFSDLARRTSTVLLEKASPSLATVSEQTQMLERLLAGGEQESVIYQRTMGMITARFGDVPQIAAKAGDFRFSLNLARANFGFAEFWDVTPKILGGLTVYRPGNTNAVDLHLPGTGFYEDWTEHFTTEGGLW